MVIRVPKALKEQVLAYARLLDAADQTQSEKGPPTATPAQDGAITRKALDAAAAKLFTVEDEQRKFQDRWMMRKTLKLLGNELGFEWKIELPRPRKVGGKRQRPWRYR